MMLDKLIAWVFFIGLLTVYFTACDDGKINERGHETFISVCTDEPSNYSDVCQLTCGGDWVRVIDNELNIFDTKEACNE